MSDNILKRIWRFLFRKKSLSEEDRLILAELKDLYAHKKAESIARQKELLAKLEENNKQEALKFGSQSSDGIDTSGELSDEIKEQLFECEHIWDEFDSVQEYLKRLLAGGDFVAGRDINSYLRDFASVEDRLNKLETYYDLLRKDKFIEPAEREAIVSRLAEIRKLIEDKKAELVQKAEHSAALAEEKVDDTDVSGEENKEDLEEVKETEDSFEKDLVSLIEEISDKYNLGLSPKEVASIIKKLKSAHLRRLFTEKIKAVDKGEKDFVRDFEACGFENTPLNSPYKNIRNKIDSGSVICSREELLEKLGLLEKEISGDKDLKKLITPQLKLMETKSQEILERRKKQYIKSRDKYYSTHEKDIEIPKELAVPLSEVLKKHMGLSVGREKFFLRRHKDKFMSEAHNVIINGKKQVFDKQKRELKKEREELLHKKHREEQNKNKTDAMMRERKQKQRKEERLKHIRELAELEHKKQMYYQMRQKLISATETKKKLLENKIDNNEQRIREVKESIKQYEQKKMINQRQAKEQLKNEQKNLQHNVDKQRQRRKEMQQQYLEKIKQAEKEKQERWEKMRQANMQRQKQEQENSAKAQEKIKNMRSMGNTAVGHQVKGDFSKGSMVGSRFGNSGGLKSETSKEYHRDFGTGKQPSEIKSNNQRIQDSKQVQSSGISSGQGDAVNVNKKESINKAKEISPQNSFEGTGKHDQSIHAKNIEGQINETSQELEKALADKAHKMRQEAMQKNIEQLNKEHLNVSAKIKNSKKAFSDDVNEHQKHEQVVKKDLMEKQQHIKEEMQKKQEAETLRMQELHNMREAVLEQKQAKQKEQKAKMEQESKNRRTQMLADQKKKREEAKKKMEEEHKRREELRRKMENEKKRKAEELQKKKDEEARKREEIKRKRQEEKKRKAEELKKKKDEEARKREEAIRKREAEKQKKMAEARQKQLEDKKKEDAIRRKKMLEEQKKRREQARKAMEKKEKGL